jgi:hypothetical protein
MLRCHSLSLVQPITLSLSKLSLLQRMASNNNGKHKLEKEVESLTTRKRLWLSDDDGCDDDSSDLSEEETKEEEDEVSSEESSMKLDTSEEKLMAKQGRRMIFSHDDDTAMPSSEPCTPIVVGAPMRTVAMKTTTVTMTFGCR